ncbi:hypothetical protein [Dyadobacter sp.]|uniref:hypothetical protein n=1 Tax=Dyadobacter sp. TaxID=1914288 RepID=UPI003F726A82
MEQLQGILLSEFPYSDLNKVSDLIEFDGPLLSHYRDSNDNNFLFYWIDNDENLNRWMLLEVDTDDLWSYVHSDVSLRDIIRAKANVIITHIDRDLNYSENLFMPVSQLPQSYLPVDDSYYPFDIPSEYYKSNIESQPGAELAMFKHQEEFIADNQYLTILREGANVYRLRPKEHKYNHAVKAKDAGKFLTNITNSASVYTTFEFYNNFKDHLTDPDKLKSTLQTVKKSTELLVIDTQFRSFEVTLSMDTVMGMDENLRGYKEWRKKILANYYRDVIDIDHSSEESINILREKFPEEAIRKKIVKPIADILVDPSFVLETKSSVGSAPTLHSTINRATYKKLIAPAVVDGAVEQSERKKIVSMIVEVTERDGKNIFGKKTLEDGLIFQSEIGQAALSLNYLNYEQYEISFKKPVDYQYFIDDNNLNNINCPVFNLAVSGQSKKEVMNDFWKILGRFIIESFDKDLNKELMDEYVEYISAN